MSVRKSGLIPRDESAPVHAVIEWVLHLERWQWVKTQEGRVRWGKVKLAIRQHKDRLPAASNAIKTVACGENAMETDSIASFGSGSEDANTGPTWTSMSWLKIPKPSIHRLDQEGQSKSCHLQCDCRWNNWAGANWTANFESDTCECYARGSQMWDAESVEVLRFSTVKNIKSRSWAFNTF